MQAMKDATRVLGGMNRSVNLPQLQKMTMEFERESDMMEQRQEMIDDAIDDAQEVEEEGDEIVEQVLEEIGVDLSQSVSGCDKASILPPGMLTFLDTQLGKAPSGLETNTVSENKVAQAVGSGGGPGDDDLQARLDSLRK